MRDYSRVAPAFWSGSTGKKLRGHRDAQLLALYLITCPSANMLGLYYLPLPTLLHEIGISREGASKAFRSVFEAGFAYYDEATEYVWVPEMAKFQIGGSLKPDDKRVTGIERELELHRKSPFFNAFLDRYRAAFHLKTEPANTSPFEGPSKPFEGPSKPLRSQEQEQEQEQERESAPNGASSSPPVLTLGEHGYVRMTAQQYDRVKAKLNGQTDEYIGRLDSYIAQIGERKARTKYSDHSAVVVNWFRRDQEKQRAGKPSRPTKVVL